MKTTFQSLAARLVPTACAALLLVHVGPRRPGRRRRASSSGTSPAESTRPTPAGFTIGGLRGVWPTAATTPPWNPLGLDPSPAEPVKRRCGAGDGIKVGGRFHDGVFFVESVDAVSAKSAKRGVRARVHETGVVTSADPDAFAVNGAAVDLSPAPRRRLRRRPARVGESVVVDGASRGGRLFARGLARR